MNTLTFFLAWRIFRSAHHHRLMRRSFYNAFMSLVLIMLLVVVVVALEQGFMEQTIQKVLKFEPHIMLYPKGNADGLAVIERLRQYPEVAFVEKYFAEQAVIVLHAQYVGGILRSMGPGKKAQVDQALIASSNALGGIYIGSTTAYRHKLSIGHTVTVFLPGVNRTVRRQISGILYFHIAEYDQYYMFTTDRTLAPARAIEVSLKHVARLQAVKQRLIQKYGREYSISDWRDLNGTLFMVIRAVELIFALLLGLMTILSFTYVKQYIELLIYEKYRTLHILHSLAFSPLRLTSLILLISCFISLPAILIGTGLGAVVALGSKPLLVMIDQLTRGALLQGNTAVLGYFSVLVSPLTILCLIMAGLLISFLFTLIPILRFLNTRSAEFVR